MVINDILKAPRNQQVVNSNNAHADHGTPENASHITGTGIQQTIVVDENQHSTSGVTNTNLLNPPTSSVNNKPGYNPLVNGDNAVASWFNLFPM